MDENETLDVLDARFGESPLRARMRALLAENAQLRAERDELQAALNDANAYAVELYAQAMALAGGSDNL